MLRESPRALENSVPTKSDPINPGPFVNAIADYISGLIFASSKAWLTTGIIFER